jgi:serine/threonine protein kinase
MLTGKRPFDGDTSIETLDNIIHAEPMPVARFNYAVPPDLDRVVRKCLEKDRERRYQSVRDLLIDLRNLQRDSESGDESCDGRSCPANPGRRPNSLSKEHRLARYSSACESER